jgi:UPF0755 protein
MSSIKKKQLLSIFVVIILLLGLLVFGAVIGVRRYYQNNLQSVSSTFSSVEFTIPEGYALPQISQLLKDKNLIRNKQVFEQYVRNNGTAEDIKAGTYELSPSYSVAEIVSIITEGKIASDLVTIAPGVRIDQVKKALINSGYSEQEATDALNPENYVNHPALVDKPKKASLEGYLYPESFHKTSETDAKEIIKLSLDEMSKRLTPNLREAFSKQGLSVHRAIILSSIVEGEVAKDEDRKQVAQVFFKRLESGIKLQSDVTAKYGAAIDGVINKLNYAQLLAYSSPYNTYERKGLPPGPISNVSESSLNAVSSPAKTDWLYFVSGDDGTTHFSKTLAEHLELTKRYCKELCAN